MTDTTLPDGWVLARLDEIAEVRLGRQRSPKNHSGQQMRPYLRAANVTWDGIDVKDVKTMNFTDSEVETYRLVDGDVLLSEASGSPGEVGKPGVWRSQVAGHVCFQNTLIRVRPEDGIDSGFLYYRFLHEALRGGFAESSRGVGIHHLGAAKLAALSIEVAPYLQQKRIAAELDAQMSRFKAMVSGVEGLVGRVNVSRESRLGRMRSLLLRQAFAGLLVKADPADQPAELLIKQILENRADASKSKPSKRSRRGSPASDIGAKA